MSQNTYADDANALLAELASQLESISKKTSPSSLRKPKCSESFTKKPKDVVRNRNGGLVRNHKEDSTDADNRLKEFMKGLRPAKLADEDEHWYEPSKGRTYTLQEIADIMGVSRERVRQVEELALRKMWSYVRAVNKREGVSEDEMFQSFRENGDSTVYMP